MSGNKYEPSRSKYDPIPGHGPGASARRLRAKERRLALRLSGLRPTSEEVERWFDAQGAATGSFEGFFRPNHYEADADHPFDAKGDERGEE